MGVLTDYSNSPVAARSNRKWVHYIVFSDEAVDGGWVAESSGAAKTGKVEFRGYVLKYKMPSGIHR